MKSKTVDFGKYSSVKIGGVVEVSVLESAAEVRAFEGVLVGGANNMLLGERLPPLAFLGDAFKGVEFRGDSKFVCVGARTNSAVLFKFAKEHGVGGFEFMKKIPGTLGGMLKMNAGVKGFDISKIVQSVRTSEGEFDVSECGFGYRKSAFKGVVLEACLAGSAAWSVELENALSYVRSNQPRGASFGSCFKNPTGESAGRLLESVGLRGFRRGGCEFSAMHANFLINTGGGKFEDALWLINEAKRRVFETCGVELEREVVVLGE